MKKLLGIMVMTFALIMAGCGGSSHTKPSENSTKPEGGSKKITFKIGNSQADTHPWNAAIDELNKRVIQYSNGQLEIVNYPNATLGNENDMLESVRQGSLDMCIADPTVGTTFCKELEVFSLPFLFRDKDHWTKVMDGPIGAEYKKIIDEKGKGIKILAFWGGSTRNVLSTKKIVTNVEALQGFKLRLAPSELKFKIWEAIGALPVNIAFGETYSAMSSGLCDGMENEMPSILAAKFYEPAPNFTMTAHEITTRPLFINKKSYEGLSEENKKALDKAVAESTMIARVKEAEAAKSAEKIMIERFGVKEYQIDKKPIMDRVRNVYEDYGKQSGMTDFISKVVKVQ